jgi:hypothetical protein
VAPNTAAAQYILAWWDFQVEPVWRPGSIGRLRSLRGRCERIGQPDMAQCCQRLRRSCLHRVLSDPASTLGGRRHGR